MVAVRGRLVSSFDYRNGSFGLDILHFRYYYLGITRTLDIFAYVNVSWVYEHAQFTSDYARKCRLVVADNM